MALATTSQSYEGSVSEVSRFELAVARTVA